MKHYKSKYIKNRLFAFCYGMSFKKIMTLRRLSKRRFKKFALCTGYIPKQFFQPKKYKITQIQDSIVIERI